MTTRQRLLGAGLAALLLAWVFGPALTAPPLYDGIGFPDEPYRYVQRPAKTIVMPPPTAAHGATTRTASGVLDQLRIFGGENPPQLQTTIAAGDLTSSACAQVTGDGRALAPQASAGPARSWGNVYRVLISCGSTPVTFTPSNRSMILLRAPDARRPGPGIFFRADPAGAWLPLSTSRIGNDNFRAPFAGAGDYVLVLPAGGGGVDPLLIAGIVLLAALIGLIVLVRLRRSSPPQSPGSDSEVD
jgi:hypothetical protein